MADELERLVEAVLGSRKYHSVCPDFVRHLGALELARRRNLKQAIQATKNKLHQVGGAYLEGRPDYPGWLVQLQATSQAGDRERFRQVCARLMAHHASTRERLPILDRFYTTVLADLPPIHSVLDVACGLNPLAIPWMPLAEGASYTACDLYQDMLAFLDAFLALVPVRGHTQTCDVLHACPTQPVDLALLLKVIPCLEQIDRSAGARLLDALHADYLLVSFPVRSLGGRDKGMVAHYEARLHELLAGRPWTVRRFEFPSELAFLVDSRQQWRDDGG